ncbi:LOW QUALITY PROTEIN: hypothetical protein HID58_094463, partial [Brassica napus]
SLRILKIVRLKEERCCVEWWWWPAGKKKAGSVPVYLNVYDLTPINGYAYWLGLGVYHSGVEVHGVEYGFGAHEHSTTGIFEVEPKQCPGFTFRKSILIGRTDLDPEKVRAFMEKLSEEYSGENTTISLQRTVITFATTFLTRRSIPSWVNRLARFGLFCNCVLPAELNETKVRQVRSKEEKVPEAEEKKLGSRSSRFPPGPSLSSSGSLNRSRRGGGERRRQCLPPSPPVSA